MDLSKGLFRNGDPVQQPPGSYPFGKNGVGFEKLGAIINEPGFTKVVQTLPGTVAGMVPTDAYPVLLVVVGTTLRLYKLDPATLAVTLLKDLSTLPDAPAFSAADYFTGEAERNYKGDLVIAVINKVIRPLYINLDDLGSYTSFKDLYLVPLMTAPRTAGSVVGGGILDEGVYFPFVSYEMRDGARTHFLFTGITAIVGKDAPNRLIELELTGVDARYDFVTLGVLHRSGGVSKAFKLAPQPIAGGSMRLSLTGAETRVDQLPEELLAIPPDYTKAKAIGQLNGELYLGNLEVDDAIDYQALATKVKVEWTSTLLDLTGIPDAHAHGTERSLMHQEVYAVYIRLWTTAGRPSRWFHIPGPKPTAAHLQQITHGNVTAPRYQLQDTVVGRTPGVWVNAAETYPDDVSFDASTVGGENLRGQAVRHHRMPSIGYLKTNLYSADLEYGRTKLDRLGLKISNVTLPAALQGKIAFYEVGFAQRSVANSTVLGVSHLIYGATDPSSQNPNTVIGTGGNWNGGLKRASGEQDTPHYINRRYFRLHPLEVLYYRPKAELWALSPQLKYRLEAVGITEIDDGVQNGSNIPCVITVDYTNGTSVVSNPNLGPLAVEESHLLRGHTTRGFYNNALLEGALVGKLKADGPAINIGQSTFPHAGKNYYSKPAYEETFLVSLLLERSDLYESFTQQQVVPCGALTAPGQVVEVAAGDAFCSLQVLHTYGRDLRDSSENAYFDPKLGLRTARRFATVSVVNHHLRFEEAGNSYSRFWPLSPLSNGAQDNYLTMHEQSQDPNQIGYNRDYNSLFDLDPGSVFSPYNPELTRFPYRVHRFGKTAAGNRFRSWRNLLALDYYEIQRHLGEIINIDGDENLIIHTEHALLLTRDKAKLMTGPLAVTLGTGDIFQFEPQEGLSAPMGYAGTRHDLACVRCPLGYLFVDAQAGDIFLYKGGLKSLAGGLSLFLREELKVAGRNPFTGSGITLGFDPHFKRVLLTVKNGDRSFTLSYSVLGECWTFFHDYVPDYYIPTRNQLFNLKGANLYKMNAGVPGVYHDAAAKPFFVDVAVPFGKEMTLDAVQWLANGARLTHLTVWNGRQTTGRITLQDNPGVVPSNHRETRGYWSINVLRNIAVNEDFLEGLFSDFAVKAGATNPTLPWYGKSLIEDNFVIIRLEYDNLAGTQLTLQDIRPEVSNSTR